jgi:preprotein translocase subunit SecD
MNDREEIALALGIVLVFGFVMGYYHIWGALAGAAIVTAYYLRKYS